MGVCPRLGPRPMSSKVKGHFSARILVAFFGLLLVLGATSEIVVGGSGTAAAKRLRRRPRLMTTHQRQKRAEYLASLHGLQYGVPKHAMARAVGQMRAMERRELRGARDFLSLGGSASLGQSASTSEFSGALP